MTIELNKSYPPSGMLSNPQQPPIIHGPQGQQGPAPQQAPVVAKEEKKTFGLISGRIAYIIGDLVNGEPKLDENKQPKYKKDGKPWIQHGIGLLVQKTMYQNFQENGGAGNFDRLVKLEIHKMYPQGQPPDFATKMIDCDDPNNKGQTNRPYYEREGHAGHILYRLSSTYPMKCYVKGTGPDGKMAFQQVDGGIKAGDSVTVQVEISVHGSAPLAGGMRGKPGIYLNPKMLVLEEVGPAFAATGPSPAEVFITSQPPALPPMQQQPPMGPQPPPPPPTQAPQPHYGVLPQNMQQPPAQGGPLPQGSPQPQWEPAAPQWHIPAQGEGGQPAAPQWPVPGQGGPVGPTAPAGQVPGPVGQPQGGPQPQWQAPAQTAGPPAMNPNDQIPF